MGCPAAMRRIDSRHGSISTAAVLPSQRAQLVQAAGAVTALALAVLAPSLAAQGLWERDYRDLTFVRNRPSAWKDLLELRAGILGNRADDEQPAVGLEDTQAPAGHFYWRQSNVGGRDAIAELYGGLDGAFFALKDDVFLGKRTSSRLEVSGRYFPFYREGFYQGSDFVPTGRYEGTDWGVALGFSGALSENMRLEFGPFFRRYEFARNSRTAANYVIPDHYLAYGGRMFLEQGEMQNDRETGRPIAGYLLTLGLEREQNTSDRTFGVQGVWESSLPAGVWRGRGKLEWYLPQSDWGTWVVRAEAAITDEDDRVHNYDAQKPVGNIWADAELGYRLDLGGSFSLLPVAKGQYVRILEESGFSSNQEFFFGGGLSVMWQLGTSVALVGDYSWISNESRPPVSPVKDTFGEHRYFVGMLLRFGEAKR